MPLDRPLRDAQGLRDFLIREAAEKLQDDHVGFLGVGGFELLEGFFERQDILVPHGRGEIEFIHIDALCSPAVLRARFAPGGVHQDVPHGLRQFEISPAAAGIWATICLMCCAEYLGVVEPYLDRHYFIGSVCLMGALVLVVVLASPTLRYFFLSAAARARKLARMRAA